MTPSPPSSRKKPTCRSCGQPMAGHKRPTGIPICPRTSLSPPPPPPFRTAAEPATPPPTSAEPRIPPRPSDSSPDLLSRISPEDVRFSPTPSGYWHRQNPYWVEPAHYARMPLHAVHVVPQRGETVASWNSTELDEASADAPPTHGEPLSREHAVDDIAKDPEDAPGCSEPACARATPSPSPSIAFTRLGRHVSKILAHRTPLAALYSAPSEDVFALEHAAHEQGLSTAVVRSPRSAVKAEPASPAGVSHDDDDGGGGWSRASLTRESSWWVFVGRDRGAVHALAGSQARTAAAAAAAARGKDGREPYDYDRGLEKARDERVGAYPVDPRTVRQNFCDVIIAAVLSAVGVVWLLSSM
ncbi:hypothetical protein BC628DRAFT_1414991 [Trametes gibbosa]|nr:hypothetical protein BC628DRAFT_1414991 [Trametes gibbosa]